MNNFNDKHLIIEESDFDFSKNWDDLTIDEKADFLSFCQVPFLNDDNRSIVIGWWEYYQLKNNIEL